MSVRARVRVRVTAAHWAVISAMGLWAAACTPSDQGSGGGGGQDAAADLGRDLGRDAGRDIATETSLSDEGETDLSAPDEDVAELDASDARDLPSMFDARPDDSGLEDSPSEDTGAPDSGPASCPAPPADEPAASRQAAATANALRVATGVGCATLVPAIDISAQRHCDYYVANSGACIADPHTEVEGCTDYVAADFWDRMAMAGYTGSPAFEDMHFLGNAPGAVQDWVDSVWHRTPILSPWVRDFGYGQRTGCDTMDFGVGAASPNDMVATYPYDGQTGVPTAFEGNELPQPPAPPNGFPCGYPIFLFAKGATVTQHVLTVDGSDTPIAHMWLTPQDNAWYADLITEEHILYANDPLAAHTRYRVHISGTYVGGALDVAWTFTTQ